MLADLPPSSCATRLTVSAASFATLTPAVVDPVKDTMSISGWAAIASPTVGPSPFTRLKTPAGMPASWMISASSIVLSGAISLGFRTTVQPVASAGAVLEATWFSGQFHGVISPHTPMGLAADDPVPHPLLEFVFCKHAGSFLEMKQRDSRLMLGRERDRRAHFEGSSSAPVPADVLGSPQ